MRRAIRIEAGPPRGWILALSRMSNVRHLAAFVEGTSAPLAGGRSISSLQYLPEGVSGVPLVRFQPEILFCSVRGDWAGREQGDGVGEI